MSCIGVLKNYFGLHFIKEIDMSLLLVYTLFTLMSLGSVIKGLTVGYTIILAAISLFTSGIYFMADYEEEKDNCKLVLKYCKTALKILVFILAPLAILIPSKSDMYTMVGVYYTTNIEGIDKLPANVVKVVNKFLEDYTDDENKHD